MLGGFYWGYPLDLSLHYKLTYQHFCRAMLCKRGVYRHAVYVCVPVCLSVCMSVTFVHSVKTSNRIFEFIWPSDSQTILVFFRTKRHGNIPTRTFLTGASNVGGVGKNRDFRPVSGFIVCCRRCDRQVLSTWCRRTVASCDTGSKRQSLLMARDDD